jgi:hypothetical protein
MSMPGLISDIVDQDGSRDIKQHNQHLLQHNPTSYPWTTCVFCLQRFVIWWEWAGSHWIERRRGWACLPCFRNNGGVVQSR